MDLYSIWDELVREEVPYQIVSSPMLQFGTERRAYLGALLLPEVPKNQNEYTETKITYKTFPAQDGTRYSEPKMQGQQIVGTFSVRLGEVDTASQLTGHDLDALIEIAEDNPTLARSRLIQWMTNAFGVSLAEKAEIQRWQAIVDAAVDIIIDGTTETVEMRDPTGHRFGVPSGTLASPAGWYADDYDPMDDIYTAFTTLRDKGYVINRIVGDTQLLSVLASNDIMRQRLGSITFSNNGSSINTRQGLVSAQALNNYLQAEWGLPPIELYDTTYAKNNGSGRDYFKKRGAMCFVSTTGRDEMFDRPTEADDQTDIDIITDTLGYYAIGRPVGQATSGKVIETEVKTMKPVGIYGQSFQTSFPVITEPEAIAVIQIDPPAAA